MAGPGASICAGARAMPRAVGSTLFGVLSPQLEVGGPDAKPGLGHALALRRLLGRWRFDPEDGDSGPVRLGI